jgi:hypothetical protein
MSTSQPNVTGDPSTYQPKAAPPVRPGNPAGVGKPFKVGG